MIDVSRKAEGEFATAPSWRRRRGTAHQDYSRESCDRLDEAVIAISNLNLPLEGAPAREAVECGIKIAYQWGIVILTVTNGSRSRRR